MVRVTAGEKQGTGTDEPAGIESKQRAPITLVCGDSIWDHAISWLLSSAGLEIGARARDVDRAPDLVARHPQHVLLVHVDEDLEPERLYKRLKEAHRLRPAVDIVVICRPVDVASRDSAFAAGATRVTSRDNALEILRAVQALWHEDVATSERPRLTRREVEILRLVAEGRTNREVAQLAWVTEQTVKFHLASIYKKLGIHSRAEAMVWAAANGMTTDFSASLLAAVSLSAVSSRSEA
jgi:DNA-binding NarL/FixJ family response regulator